jgi:uncharacterized membrane protein YeiH
VDQSTVQGVAASVAEFLRALATSLSAPGDFQVPPLFDYGATFAWAISGALVAARRGYDVAGIAAIALVSAVGGGLLRDGIFLQQGPPQVVRSPWYLILVLIATALVLLVGHRVRNSRRFAGIVELVDALGLGMYAVVGTQASVAVGLSLFGAALVGVVNAVGGGVLRGMLKVREPEIFRPGAFMSTAALLGVIVYLLLTVGMSVDQGLAGWITVAVAFAARVASLRFHLTTTPAVGFSGDPDSTLE